MTTISEEVEDSTRQLACVRRGGLLRTHQECNPTAESRPHDLRQIRGIQLQKGIHKGSEEHTTTE